jgi:uncharacterized protein YggE
MDRIVSVGSTITKSFEADELSVEVTISGRRDTRSKCTSSYNSILRQVRDALNEAGVPEDLVRNSDFKVSPHVEQLYLKEEDEDRYYRASHRIDGYEFEATVNVKVKAEAHLASPIWVALCSCDEGVSFDFDYELSDRSSRRDELLQEAILEARERAGALAAATAAKLGSIISIKYQYDGGYGRSSYTASSIRLGARESAPEFKPEAIEVECSVDTQWELVV